MPLARGTRVGAVARAWIERTAEGVKERDTGDLRALEVIAVESDARSKRCAKMTPRVLRRGAWASVWPVGFLANQTCPTMACNNQMTEIGGAVRKV